VARKDNDEEHEASPKSANKKTQWSTSTSKMLVGLQNINNTNKLPRVMPCLKLYLSHVPLWALFSWLDSPSGPWPPHFQGYMITFRRGLHTATLHTSC